jgi:hypothetical protein
MRSSLSASVWLLVILLLHACSNFKDNLDNFPPAPNLHVSPDQVHTELPVIDLRADPDEFQNMYDNPRSRNFRNLWPNGLQK